MMLKMGMAQRKGRAHRHTAVGGRLEAGSSALVGDGGVAGVPAYFEYGIVTILYAGALMMFRQSYANSASRVHRTGRLCSPNNAAPAGAFRGAHGTVNTRAFFAFDIVASTCSWARSAALDPFEVRRKNWLEDARPFHAIND
jgi:hypothetical protein